MPSAEKVERVREVKDRLQAAPAAVFANYRGLTVQDIGELRTALSEVDAQFAVVKNSLTRLAVRDAGLEDLEPFIDGPTAIAFLGGDPVAGAKRLVDAARKFQVMEIRGGFAEGRVLGADEIRSLAALEPREVMLAKLAGLARMQLGRAAWMFQAHLSRFAALLEAFRKKTEAEAPAEEPPAEEPAAEPEAAAEEPAAEAAEEPTEEQKEEKEGEEGG